MRDARVSCSPSFSLASQKANSASVPVLATYIYIPERQNLAQRIFLLEGLLELKKSFGDYGTPFLAIKAKDIHEAAEIAARLSANACEVVIDAAYLRPDVQYEECVKKLMDEGKRKLTKVEGNVVVPVAIADNGPAIGARTIRKKIWKYATEMISEEWNDLPELKCDNWKKIVDCTITEMDLFAELKNAREDCETSRRGLVGGEIPAQKVLKRFLDEKLKTYHQLRNVPDGRNQSFLSPYLHFGMVNPVDIIHQVLRAKAPKLAKDAFLEEIIIRRELSHNFVYYYKDTYDTFDCLPAWARQTMKKHEDDKRQVIYSVEDLEAGKTHDPYWNAAQFELIHTHKMHGYMRMYWAKKVIEWSENYESALQFLLEQNDKYELDGRDPNGYAGIIWNFGMHDRAFKERPVFGKLRYMNAEGLRRKFKTSMDDYVKLNYELAGRTFVKEYEAPTKKGRMRTLKDDKKGPPPKLPKL